VSTALKNVGKPAKPLRLNRQLPVSIGSLTIQARRESLQLSFYTVRNGFQTGPAANRPNLARSGRRTTDYSGIASQPLAGFSGAKGPPGTNPARVIELGTPTKTPHRATNR
jgi:hypothetical protein